MYTIDKICEIMEEKGLKQKDLTDYLGVNKNVYTGWKSGRIKSYSKYLPQIAEFLGVSVGYLLGEEEKKEKPTYEGELSEGKKKLIDFAMSVPEEKAELLLRIMKTIAEDEQ